MSYDLVRIFQVTAWDNLGQQFNGYQIHKSLLLKGHDSCMAVNQKGFQESHIYQLGNRVTRKIDKIFTKIEKKLSLYSIASLSAATLYFNNYYKRSELVHLQLIHADQFFSLFNLLVISRQKRVVWTLHDPWMLSGHCVHSLDCDRWITGCGNCPDLTLSFPIKRDTTALTWKLKHWIMHHSQITLVVASQWMYKRVKQSPILSHLPCHIIPLGLDTKIFQPREKSKSRNRFGIPLDAQVLSFRYKSGTDSFKGWQWLEQSLISLEIDKPTYLISFDNKGGMEKLRDKYNVIELGWVQDQDLLCDAMNATDIFLMPSIAESFGMMAVEAMACGTPVIVFENTALQEVVQAPRAGIAVPYKNAKALTEAIANLLQDSDLRKQLSKSALELVRSKYDIKFYIDRHISLYENIINGSGTQ
jgi:glycosyltransferase involved in cell wall biosynthesis